MSVFFSLNHTHCILRNANLTITQSLVRTCTHLCVQEEEELEEGEDSNTSKEFSSGPAKPVHLHHAPDT